MATSVAAGSKAPPFRLPSTDGDISLDELLAGDHRAVIAFYAEDGTPACQTELAMLRDAHDLIAEFSARVVGISSDSLESHRAFAERVGGLPFPLASDAEVETAGAYGVIDEGDARRSRRAIFVVDRDATVLLSLPHFQPQNLAQVEAIFEALGSETPA
jgi:peroxiredoxin Q/BCP